MKLATKRNEAAIQKSNIFKDNGIVDRIGLLLIGCFLISAFGIGCSEDPSVDNDETYANNTFWVGEGVPAKHPPRKAHVDFFDKVCTKSGKDFECHYTDE